MEIFIVSVVAMIASALTLFSGFGLGTLLMPVVALFFPIEVAIAITAIVHLANNLFKLILVGKNANKFVALKFGLPAVVFAFLGALLLSWLSSMPAIYSYEIFGLENAVTPISLIVGILILIFVVVEISPALAGVQLEKKYLSFGGAISGFFGGLSGHQGALRSMFLIKAGLTKEQFIATGVVIAVLVDIARLLIYGWDISFGVSEFNWTLLLSACCAAFAGAYFGAKLVNKITIRSVQLIVSVMLAVVALGMVAGLV